MNENLAFIFGLSLGVVLGAILAFAIMIIAAWQTDRRDGQTSEDGK